MKPLAEFIAAVAALLWPIFAFTLLWTFRHEIRELLRRIQKGKLFGQEFELDTELDKLRVSAEKSQDASAKIPPPPVPQEPRDAEQFTVKVLQESARSPRAALMLLAAEIEKRLRHLLAATGWHPNIGAPHLPQAVDQFSRQGTLPGYVSGSLKLFLDVRNKIVHGKGASDADMYRAIDSGLTLLRAIDSVPVEKNVVYHPGVDIFSDADCSTKIPDAKGVILETTSPGGVTKSYRIFPTTRTHFQKGRQVAWEWNFEKAWAESWYREPDTQKIKKAWDDSAEFIGRHLDET